MRAPPTPEDERYRKLALDALDLLDTEPEAEFDAIVQLGRTLFSVPMCLVSLVDSDRQWFKAKAGLDATETPRAISFCGHAILGRSVFVVLDATQDERFHDNPVVTGPPHVRFYAGAPVRLPNGYTIGTVCLVSPEPRAAFPDEDRARLEQLAGLVLQLLAVRAMRRELDAAKRLLDRFETLAETAVGAAAFADADGVIRHCTPAFDALAFEAGAAGGAGAIGMTLNDALGLAPEAWSPGRMLDSGDLEATVPLPDARRLTVYCDAEGFAAIVRE